MCTSYNQLTEDQRLELLTIIEGSADMSFIRTLLYNKFGIVLNDNAIASARQGRMFSIKHLKKLVLIRVVLHVTAYLRFFDVEMTSLLYPSLTPLNLVLLQ